jgi:hypothetical protein
MKFHLPFRCWKSRSSSTFPLGSLLKWIATTCKFWSGISYTCISKLWLVKFVGHCWFSGWICVVLKDLFYTGWWLAGAIIFFDKWFCLKVDWNCCCTVAIDLRLIMPKVVLNLLLLHAILYYSAPATKQTAICHKETWSVSINLWIHLTVIPLPRVNCNCLINFQMGVFGRIIHGNWNDTDNV